MEKLNKPGMIGQNESFGPNKNQCAMLYEDCGIIGTKRRREEEQG